jgi:hypothetical protein
MNKNNKALEHLKIFYVAVFALSALLIAPTHIFPKPYFMYARFPTYLMTMKPFFGINWPQTFELYHIVLYILCLVGALNAFGVLIYPKLKKLTAFSATIGIILTSLMILFFFLKFIGVNILNAVILGIYSIILLILNISTLKAAIRK